MVKCICIDSKNRPEVIPTSKWLKEGEEYTIIFTIICLPQRLLSVELKEISLGEAEQPYEYFLASRFAIAEEDLELLIKLIKDCTETDFSVDELMKQTELIKPERKRVRELEEA